MVKIIVTITAFFISLISLAQVSENREVSCFSNLKVSSGIDVFYKVSDKINVTVETDNLEKLKLIKTEVENGTLNLYIDTKGYEKTKSKDNNKKKDKNRKYISFINGVEFQMIKITISGPNLEGIKTSSSSSVKFENTNTSSNLDIDITSSASISGSFNCENLTINTSSSGDFLGSINATSIVILSSSSSDLNLSGKAVEISVKASSSSTCDLKKLIVETAIIQASSSADIAINATKSLNAKASSSASIAVYGNPLKFKKEESSSGSIFKK